MAIIVIWQRIPSITIVLLTSSGGHRGACFINDLGLDLDIDNDSIYLYGAYTSPEARMKGLYTSTMKELFDVYMSQGISKIFGIVEQTNPYSYNIHLKLKFKPIGKVIFITLAMFKLSIYYDIENDNRTARFYISFPQNKMLI